MTIRSLNIWTAHVVGGLDMSDFAASIQLNPAVKGLVLGKDYHISAGKIEVSSDDGAPYPELNVFVVSRAGVDNKKIGFDAIRKAFHLVQDTFHRKMPKPRDGLRLPVWKGVLRLRLEEVSDREKKIIYLLANGGPLIVGTAPEKTTIKEIAEEIRSPMLPPADVFDDEPIDVERL